LTRTRFHLALLVAGVVLGFLAGALVGPPMVHVSILGELFLLALRMVVVPLVAASLVTGVAALTSQHGFGRALRVALVYFFVTMAIAVAIGILLVTTLRPGEGFEGASQELSENVQTRGTKSLWENVQDLLRSFLAPNLFGALASDRGILAVILFAMAFGGILGTLGARGDPVRRFFEVVNDVLSTLISWVVLAAPVGVFALIAARIAEKGGGRAALDVLESLAWYATTVIAGLALHGFLVLPAALRFLGRRAVGPYAKGMLPALLTAFATSSSSATLPVTMRCVAANGVSDRAARFVIPVGTTVNMNGTALYEAVAAIFIAQAYGVALGPVEVVLVAVTAVLAAVGAAAIPEAGLVTMVMVLSAVGLPTEGIGLILSIDWFLDRCRTTVNVWDDAVGSAVVERLAGLSDGEPLTGEAAGPRPPEPPPHGPS
jgi:Na+/H+-dicarboxylate symporter